MMSGIGKKGLVGLVVALCLLLALTLSVFAGLRVAGVNIENTVAPGSETTYTINIADTTDTPMDVAIEVKGYGDAQSGVDVLAPEEDGSPYTARHFLSVSHDRVHLEPGESQDIIVTAKIPTGIGGGRYAIIDIHTVPPEGSSFSTVAAVAARVLLTIEGSDLIKSAEISEIQLVESESAQTLEMTAIVKNTGNYHYKISATGSVKNEQGKVVATSSPLQTRFPLIPTYSRQISVPLEASESLPAGKYQLEMEVRADDGTLIAQETGQVELGETLSKKRSINWTLIGGICGGVVILILVFHVVRMRRRYL